MDYQFAEPAELLLVQHFSFVLTSIDSKWTFGFCRHDPKTETALVVLSALPWHETFYKLLNHIASLTSNASGEDPWKFLEIIYTCGVPAPGNSISIPLPNSTANFICQSPKQFQLPSIPENRNLTEYYSAVDSHNMMMIFASMLYERRIIFISKRLSRLSACVQACNALIYPMIWQHIYIPVLPLSLIDYLLAPMPFLIGVPTLTLQKVPKSDLGEVVILDADNNTIESPFQDLESLPQDVMTTLKKALRNRSALLGDSFLRALVQLTAGYREALTLQQGERITFNQNAFVESRPSSMQPFLRKMLELQIFQQFIEERLNMLNSGLGFSDEFEMEACSYSAKSSSKFMQQYREWTYTMRKESSAFFRSVKDKASVKYAVRSVKDKGKDMKTAYKGLKWKGRLNRSETNMRFHQPRSAPSSPTLDRRPIGFTSPPKSPNGVSVAINCRKDLRLRNNNFTDTSKKQYSPLSPSSPEESDSPLEHINIDLMHELQDVIFPNIPPVDKTTAVTYGDIRINIRMIFVNFDHVILFVAETAFSCILLLQLVNKDGIINACFFLQDSSDVPDLIRLDSINSNDDFDPLLSKSSEFSSTKQTSQSLHLPEMGEGLSNPLYPYFQQPLHKTNDKPKTSDNVGDTDLLQAYGIDFNKFSLSNGDNSSTINTAACNQSSDNSINDTMDTFSLTLDAPTIKSQNNWTKFE
ncbi:DENN domain-containing protein 1A [Trachymyrmex zeteki]|uniref:DENN domain-containing protein 1A n=1 Tax=Mycetomoellerius zeteki TaxID=64791 RepID=A0A151X0G1_9HYME|nr:DENN domain-containing protein 1A [Trachymyrmex zeteki]